MAVCLKVRSVADIDAEAVVQARSLLAHGRDRVALALDGERMQVRVLGLLDLGQLDPVAQDEDVADQQGAVSDRSRRSPRSSSIQ